MTTNRELIADARKFADLFTDLVVFSAAGKEDMRRLLRDLADALETIAIEAEYTCPADVASVTIRAIPDEIPLCAVCECAMVDDLAHVDHPHLGQVPVHGECLPADEMLDAIRYARREAADWQRRSGEWHDRFAKMRGERNDARARLDALEAAQRSPLGYVVGRQSVDEPFDLDRELERISPSSLAAHLDPSRPYDGQPHTDTGERGKTEIRGITFRDLRDCLIRSCYEASGLPIEQWPGTVYDLPWHEMDIIAVVDNLGCNVEKAMGIFPNVPRLYPSDPTMPHWCGRTLDTAVWQSHAGSCDDQDPRPPREVQP